jgi:hypothetical protein
MLIAVFIVSIRAPFGLIVALYPSSILKGSSCHAAHLMSHASILLDGLLLFIACCCMPVNPSGEFAHTVGLVVTDCLVRIE